MQILIIEDEVKTAAFLKKGFSECGVEAEVVGDGEEGLKRALESRHDIVILDVMLPKVDGWSVIRELRRRRIQTPVIMLTALGSIPDRIKGFELGVDDYLIKPFAFSELLVRISAIIRRCSAHQEEKVRVGALELDPTRGRATREGKRLDLTHKEFAILLLLAGNPGMIFTKSAIAQKVWGLSCGAESNLIEVHINRLRNKVDGPFDRKLIHTARGRGYVLEERD
ncbi:response regulator [Geomonas sp. Red32]|uniref:response regulator n=1 Tax=Geomonas sp. Red32 TaxID=2912856 RepID=UPI00202CAAF5|nr:response regulator [Geomonas sp. Red32]MCM0081763.1 response regulator [Geomonas sp. Red32]